MNLKIIPCLVAVSLIGTLSSYAKKPTSYQSSARPFGLDVVDVVQEAGSDKASKEFQSNRLPVILNYVNQNLSESQALTDLSAVALDPNALMVQSESLVRVYFVSEGAGYHNTLGFNSKNTNNGKKSSEMLIFPDASSQNVYTEDPSTLPANYRNSNFPLIPGDFVDLGVYGPFDQINFWLIPDGANGGLEVYDADATTNPDQKEHLVAYSVQDSPYLLLGFEDMPGGGDLDYNDLVFAVSYLPNPEPSTWLMMAMVLGLSYCHFKKNRKGIDSSRPLAC